MSKLLRDRIKERRTWAQPKTSQATAVCDRRQFGVGGNPSGSVACRGMACWRLTARR